MMGVGAKRALGLYRSCAPRQLDAGTGLDEGEEPDEDGDESDLETED